MRAALDTNVLVYAEGVGDSKRVSTSRELLDGALAADLVIPVQCLGELFRVLTGKAGRSRDQARHSVLSWMDAFEVETITGDAWPGAMELWVTHQLSSWDALALNVAAQSSRCHESAADAAGALTDSALPCAHQQPVLAGG